MAPPETAEAVMPPDPPSPSLLARLAHIWDPAHLRDWSRSFADPSCLRAFLVRQLYVFVLTARSVIREEITLRAAALTYNTILSIVPMLAVGFALFKAFGGLKRLEEPLRNVVMENLAVGRAAEVGLWLDKFIQNISAGAIAGVGVLVLFYSAIGLLTNIEGTINRIWGIERGRPIFIRFAIYWCLVTLAPPLLGLSVSISARLQNSAFATAVLGWLPFGLGKVVLAASSALGVCVAFTLIYVIVPATKVRFKAAVLGGIVAGVLWSITKYVFIVISAGTLKYSAVYGALGVLPLLMLWIYVSWLIVLFGATFAYANHSVSTDHLDPSALRLTPAARELLALRLTTAIADHYRAGDPAPTADPLAEEVGGVTSVSRQMLRTLVQQGILAETGAEGDPGYVPARDPSELTVAQVLEALRHRDGSSPALRESEGLSESKRVLAEAELASSEVLTRISIRTLTRAPAEATEPADPAPAKT
jgi:membrane protein